uniref:Activator 1 large subunit n=2 Tax=Lygus hesperus TaxID=30085 RepID=A0A0A9XI57_LYGHE
MQGGSATSRNHVLIMDEVDGMAGNEDRGGIQELISLIKGSKIPVICMCNDRNHPKIRSLVNYCFDLRFFKPRADQIKGAMMSICFKEGLKIKPDVLNNIIASTNQDIRLVLNHLSMLAAKRDSEMVVTNKELKLGAWEVLRKVFTENERRGMSLYDKLDLFFYDYSIAPLFVHENYLNVVPHAAEAKSKKDKMKLFAVAAASLCNGDLVDRAIRSHNAWSLLPTQAVFSSLIPGETLEGHVGGMVNFPEWLGKNSKKNKMDRLAQEIQSHTRLKASASNEAVRLDYARALRDSILQPLIRNGSEGVEASLAVMKEYSLLREDIESLNELALWNGFTDPMSTIDSKVKAAFTRAYNKNPVMTPFSISSAGVKKARSTQDTAGLDELNEDGEEVGGGEEEEEGEPDPMADGMIMAKKKTKAESTKEPKKKKEPKARGGGRGRGSKK